jgi:hypothetical protein
MQNRITPSLMEASLAVLRGDHEYAKSFAEEAALIEQELKDWEEVFDSLSENQLDQVNALFELYEEGQLNEDETIEGLADYLTKSGRAAKSAERAKGKLDAIKKKRSDKAKKLVTQRSNMKAAKRDREAAKKLKSKQGIRKVAGNIGRGLRKVGGGIKKALGKSQPSGTSSKPSPSSSPTPKKKPGSSTQGRTNAPRGGIQSLRK